MSEIKFKIPSRALKMLSLDSTEEMLFYMKISNTPFFKNGQRDARLIWVVTQDRLIFMDYYRVPVVLKNILSWRKKDIIPISEITSVAACKKKILLAPELMIVIQTVSKDIYEVMFYTETTCKNTFQDLKTIINELNPTAEFKNEISDEREAYTGLLFEGADDRSKKRIVFLFALLMVVFLVAIWRFYSLFQKHLEKLN